MTPREIADGLTEAQCMAVAFLHAAGVDRMPREIADDETLAAAILYSQLSSKDACASNIAVDHIEWRLTDLGREVAAELGVG